MTAVRTRHRRAAALLAALLAATALATAAWAAGDGDPALDRRPRALVLADLGAPRPAIARAVRAAARAGEVPAADVAVRRTGGALEATADAAQLAARRPAAVAGVGAGARAAVGQARSAELAPGTAWLTVR